MAYEKQKFADGMTLTAEHLNYMEDGIKAVDDALAYKQPKGSYVKTVNGAAPDESGNVNVSVSGGGNGADCVSVTHRWDGTTLVVTSASGTSSADLKGEKGDTGANGKTPVKGTDYWTAADKAEIVSEVVASFPNAEGASF